MKRYRSWGRFPTVREQKVQELFWPPESLPQNGRTLLPYGQGRSYGDSCLNDGGTLLSTRGLNRFIAFDRQKGVISCEAGVTLADILKVIVPSGWFLPVSPGTKFVSVGGAIANDIHGKNHHSSGTFGRFVKSIRLLRSNTDVLFCSESTNRELFQASIGGLGLTGLMLSAEFELKKIEGPYIDMEAVPFGSIPEFFKINESSDKTHLYTVAWLDCVSSGENFGRGVFFRGNHTTESGRNPTLSPKFLKVPFDLPGFCLNRYSMQIFNSIYYKRFFGKSVKRVVHYDPFFYPLDGVLEWNRIYGARGFLQFQCVLPKSEGDKPLLEILQRVVKSGQASFLAVLKCFGDIQSPGMLSFPRPGITLTLDFPFRGSRTITLMQELHKIVLEAKGAIYPAKDACMSAEEFHTFFPRLGEFSKLVDPAFSSSFWRRVTGDPK